MGDGITKAFWVVPTGANSQAAAAKAMETALASIGLKETDIARVVATGYGRESIPFAHQQITEISCHARGAKWLFPGAKVVIDMGGQDSKVIRMGEKGKVLDFKMNEKCAAGTGRFLDVMSRVLEMDVETFSRIGLHASRQAEISSTCTVFAESEVISHIAKGTPVAEIVAGIHDAIANRVYALARSLLAPDGDVVFTGGVAKNSGMTRALEAKIERPLRVPENPQIVGAIGAAVAAWETLAE
ncbi:hypothetical protein SY88_20665 [Clostridiales bacterium PH28_bin88]|nr:hypothetical protein SY88_20665 [Clostridiales bacterium PH28_bin88]